MVYMQLLNLNVIKKQQKSWRLEDWGVVNLVLFSKIK